MATIMVVHGAGGGGWAWGPMEPLLAARGHRLLRPTLTGLGERAHLAAPDVDLDTHITDVTALLEAEALRDVVLVGHSYGGMVVTGVADRAPGRVAKLGYLDAFVPEDGQSLLSLLPPETAAQMRAKALAEGEGWLLPPNPLAEDTPEPLRPWLAARRGPQPLRTFDQPIRLSGSPPPPRAYIYCLRTGPGDVFGPFAARARTGAGWQYLEIDATHGPHITAREALAGLLDRIATGR